MAGYFFEVVLGFVLALIVSAMNKKAQRGRLAPGSYWDRIRQCAAVVVHTYFDCAIYFSIAIEIAVTVVLARKDFSVAQGDFGAYETQIALAVSVVCMVPFLYPLASLRTSSEDDYTTRKQVPESFLFFSATVLFIYPFTSQCIHNWAPSRIGQGRGEGGTTIVTRPEWEVVESTCFGVVPPLSSEDHVLIAVFELVASLLIILTALWKLTRVIPVSRRIEGARSTKSRRLWFQMIDLSEKVEVWGGATPLLQVLSIFSPPILATPLLWGIFRLRSCQSQLAETTGVPYVGNEWGFGQVVSIVIFAPVFVDFGYLWLYS